MQRFFLPELLPKENQVVSLAPIHNQLRRVLRVKPGVQLIMLDNAGGERLMEVESVERRDTLARVVEVRQAPAEPAVPITLYQCILKSDKFEVVLQKATELGVTTIVPVISSRTVARPGRALELKQARWEAIVREAAEQSGRGGLPVVAPACTFAEAVTQAEGARLLPWEEGEANPGLVAALQQGKQPVASLSLLIGPEGGLDASEIDTAISAGWQVVTLGPRILRAETAALATLTIVSAALGLMGDAPVIKVQASDGKRPKPTTHPSPAAATKAEANGAEANEGEANKGKPSQAKAAPTDAEPAEAEPVQRIIVDPSKMEILPPESPEKEEAQKSSAKTSSATRRGSKAKR